MGMQGKQENPEHFAENKDKSKSGRVSGKPVEASKDKTHDENVKVHCQDWRSETCDMMSTHFQTF